MSLRVDFDYSVERAKLYVSRLNRFEGVDLVLFGDSKKVGSVSLEELKEYVGAVSEKKG